MGPATRREERNARISSSFTQKCVCNRDDGQQSSDARREKTVIAKGMEDEGLEIEKPESGREHDPDEEREERPALCETERGEERSAEGGEVGERSERGERHRTHRRIFAA